MSFTSRWRNEYLGCALRPFSIARARCARACASNSSNTRSEIPLRDELRLSRVNCLSAIEVPPKCCGHSQHHILRQGIHDAPILRPVLLYWHRRFCIAADGGEAESGGSSQPS